LIDLLIYFILFFIKSCERGGLAIAHKRTDLLQVKFGYRSKRKVEFFETILATYGLKYGDIWKFFFAKVTHTNSALNFFLKSFSLNELVYFIYCKLQLTCNLLRAFNQEFGVFRSSFSDFTQFVTDNYLMQFECTAIFPSTPSLHKKNALSLGSDMHTKTLPLHTLGVPEIVISFTLTPKSSAA
jgi:hypothetical protein